MTNGDRIRQMSNEELANWLDKKMGASISCSICAFDEAVKCTDISCEEGIKAYLDMEVEGG